MHFTETPVDSKSGFTAFAEQGYRYARSIVKNSVDAEELVQEAFIRLQKFEDEKSAGSRALFFTTIRNLCFDLLRKQKTRREVSLNEVESAGNQIAESSQDDTARELLENVNQILDNVPEEWADALRLKISGDLSYVEIAEVVGGTKAQVRTWIFRARRALEAELKKRGLIE